MKLKVTLSSGLGRLHFIELVRSLQGLNVESKLVSGWSPPEALDLLVDIFGRSVGQKNLASRLKLRRELEKLDGEVVGLFYPEFRTQIRKRISVLTREDKSRIARRSWEIFGASTIRHLDGHIFHVRSGAGQGGVIAEAKKRGMHVVVDHSIAHPVEMEENLRELHAKHGMSFTLSPQSPFWELVLKDCYDGDTILVNSDYVKDTFIRNGFDPAKIKVLYWGVRADFLKVKSDYRMRERNKLHLFFTGNFCLRKGASVMIDAAEQLVEMGLNFVFNIAGVCEDGKRLLEEKVHLRGCFNFHGYVLQDELKELFINSDIFVFPSFAEGSARSAMEAMGAGMPCVFTSETGSPVVHGESGLIIEKGNAAALAEAIKNLAGDETLRARLGRAAGDLISRDFQWSNFGENLEGLYKDLLGWQG